MKEAMTDLSRLRRKITKCHRSSMDWWLFKLSEAGGFVRTGVSQRKDRGNRITESSGFIKPQGWKEHDHMLTYLL